MKIPSISKFTNYVKTKILPSCLNQSAQRKNDSTDFLQIMMTDTFQRQSYSEKILSQPFNQNTRYLCRQILTSVDEITPARYKTFSDEEIKALRSEIPDDMAYRAELTVEVSKLLKNYFDNAFGKENYVFVSVGRSFASVAQCLNFMGQEAKSLPLSNLSLANNNAAEKMVHSNGFDEYKKYLYEIFGTPASLKKEKKTFIVADFCISGTTLNTAKKVLSHKEVGLNSKKIKYFRLNELLDKIAVHRKTPPQTRMLIDNFILEANIQNFDDYAPIRHLDWYTPGNIRYALKPPANEFTKKFQFCLSDILLDKSL